jgi:hypothetical protein
MATTTTNGAGLGDLDARFRAVVAELDRVGLGELQSTCRRWRSVLDGVEAKRLAAEMAPDEDERPTRRRAAAGGARSRAAARRAARRAAAVKKNPKLVDDMNSGRLSSEQADTIADAASKSDGAAACDQGLIDAVAEAGVDAGRRIASDWLQQRADKDKTQSRHDRQHRLRRMSTYTDPHRGTDVLKLEGTTSAIEELRARIELRERQLWEADGGRDLKPGEHRRTREQRLFDAAQDILLGTTAAAQTSGRPAVVLNIDASNPEAAAEMVGVGPIPDTVAAEILARANIFINIHDIDRTSLWFGRLKRRATLTQFIALAARDKGCVLCGAHWMRCEVHHLTPWNSPAKGETNIDDLALTCSTCHHDTHAAELTIVRGANGTWTTRPAHPHEIAPRRPHNPERTRKDKRPLTIVDETAGDEGRNNNNEHQRPTKQPSGNDASDDEAA